MLTGDSKWRLWEVFYATFLSLEEKKNNKNTNNIGWGGKDKKASLL